MVPVIGGLVAGGLVFGVLASVGGRMGGGTDHINCQKHAVKAPQTGEIN